MDFGALISWLQSIWKQVWFFQTVREFEEAVLLRMGKYYKSLTPGLHFKLSVLDEIITHYSKDDTILLPSQALTTSDGKSVTVTGRVLYAITDIQSFLTKVNAPQQAIADITMGVIAKNIIESEYTETVNIKIMNEISKQTRARCKKYGVHIEDVELVSLSLSRSINLYKEAEGHL